MKRTNKTLVTLILISCFQLSFAQSQETKTKNEKKEEPVKTTTNSLTGEIKNEPVLIEVKEVKVAVEPIRKKKLPAQSVEKIDD